MGILVSLIVAWAAQTEQFQKMFGFNLVLTSHPSHPHDHLSPSTSTPHLPTSSLPQTQPGVPNPINVAQIHDDGGGGKSDNLDLSSKTFFSLDWEKVSSELSELPQGGAFVWRSGEDGWRVVCKGGEVCWRAMVTTHWPRLLEHYGYSTESRCLESVLDILPHNTHVHVLPFLLATVLCLYLLCACVCVCVCVWGGGGGGGWGVGNHFYI